MRNQSQTENQIETGIGWLEGEHVRTDEFELRVRDLRAEKFVCALQHRWRNIDYPRVKKPAGL